MEKTTSLHTRTILELFNFQMRYLHKLVANIPDELLYAKQMAGYNSAGWILGHLCVEAEDALQKMDLVREEDRIDPLWWRWFENTTGKIDTVDRSLPDKATLMRTLDQKYKQLGEIYGSLTAAQRASPHPSTFLRQVLSSYDAWFAHHLTTHIAMHCGNIVVWKKMLGLSLSGY
jgi:uncharacterized damage-inducible protein DinB